MKLFDAYIYFRGRCPVGKNLDDFIRNAAMTVDAADQGIGDMAQALCDAEEFFLPKGERTLAQLQNPRYHLILSNLPDGVTGIVTDGNGTEWHTTSSKPEHLTAVYIRSLL